MVSFPDARQPVREADHLPPSGSSASLYLSSYLAREQLYFIVIFWHNNEGKLPHIPHRWLNSIKSVLLVLFAVTLRSYLDNIEISGWVLLTQMKLLNFDLACNCTYVAERKNKNSVHTGTLCWEQVFIIESCVDDLGETCPSPPIFCSDCLPGSRQTNSLFTLVSLRKINETVFNCQVVVTDITLGKKSWLLTHPL